MKRNNIKNIIKEYFFINPTIKLRVRHIERILNLPLPSVIRYCKELEKENILSTEKISNITFYKANRSNNIYRLEKKLFNINLLYKSGLIDYIKEKLSNPVIIVFGSYSRGEDIESSDVDLFIETLSKKEIQLKNFESKIKRKIQIFRHKTIKDVPNEHLANNIINGVILNGYIEVF